MYLSEEIQSKIIAEYKKAKTEIEKELSNNTWGDNIATNFNNGQQPGEKTQKLGDNWSKFSNYPNDFRSGSALTDNNAVPLVTVPDGALIVKLGYVPLVLIPVPPVNTTV